MKAKTFAEMKEVFEEYNAGFLTYAQAIEQVQCNSEAQLEILVSYNKLPTWAQKKIKLVDLDIEVERLTKLKAEAAENEATGKKAKLPKV